MVDAVLLVRLPGDVRAQEGGGHHAGQRAGGTLRLGPPQRGRRHQGHNSIERQFC